MSPYKYKCFSLVVIKLIYHRGMYLDSPVYMTGLKISYSIYLVVFWIAIISGPEKLHQDSLNDDNFRPIRLTQS
uniref:Uncharacterized protein n=1 Tax=Lepeophtheirus salmonis TaxID=72036 RepID=A0A0K2U8Z2_LEPSM